MLKESFSRKRRLAAERLAFHAQRIPALRPRLRERFASDLRALNDVLRATSLNDHYWVWSGLLLGWAREGAILEHDCLDADFAVADSDFWRLAEAIPELAKARFKLDRCFRNNEGQVTEITFMRHGARFEFFRMFPADGRIKYYLYGSENGQSIELKASLPEQSKVAFTFIGRTWLKHEDHELELRSMYGSWKTPDPSWSYLEGPDIETRQPWLRADSVWRGDVANLSSDRPTASDAS